LSRPRQIPPLTIRLVAIACLLAALSAAAPAAAKKAPDLVVTKLSAKAPAQVAPGATFKATATVKNAGARGAAGSKATFLLSRDRKLGKRDVRLAAASVSRLKARRSAAASKRLRVPAAAAGAYRLLACVDVGAKVRERNEKNNCMASKSSLRVTGAAARGPGPAATGAGAVPASRGGADGLTSFPRPANPLRASFALDSASAVSEVVPPSGGVLTTFGSDGSEYRLDLPPDALFGSAKITMTPLASLGGAPLSGGIVGGVKLEPEGLTLNRPATLTITPAGAVPALGAQTGFLAQGDGDDFHLYPLAFGPELSLQLLHFTIAGAGSATAADRQAAADRMPAMNQAQYEALIAERLRLAREREESGIPDDDWPTDLKPVHLAYYRDVVRPAMLAGLNDEAAVDAAIREGLGWLRKIEFYGNASEPEYGPIVDEIHRTMLQVLENALSRSNSACVETHDLRAIRRIVQIARTASLLGFDLGPGLDLVAKCVRFELDMDSQLTGLDAGYHVSLPNVLLELHYFNGALTVIGAKGEKQLDWLEFESHSEYAYECPLGEEPPVMTQGEINDDGTESPTATATVTFDISPLQEGTPAPADDTFGATIEINTGGAAEYYLQTQTGGCPISERYPGYIWENFWGTSLLLAPSPLYEVAKQGEEGSGSTPLTIFTKVQRGPGDLLLQVQIDHGATLTEHTSVEVFHRPLK
jgi:CARDB